MGKIQGESAGIAHVKTLGLIYSRKNPVKQEFLSQQNSRIGNDTLMKKIILTTEERYMKEAIRQAKKAAALGEVPIGCVIEYEGKIYVRGVNGYIVKGMENNKDAKRGLYMLSIPSNFIFRIQLTEFAHVYKERNINGGANPEVKTAVESMADQVEAATAGYATRDVLMRIKN